MGKNFVRLDSVGFAWIRLDHNSLSFLIICLLRRTSSFFLPVFVLFHSCVLSFLFSLPFFLPFFFPGWFFLPAISLLPCYFLLLLLLPIFFLSSFLSSFPSSFLLFFLFFFPFLSFVSSSLSCFLFSRKTVKEWCLLGFSKNSQEVPWHSVPPQQFQNSAARSFIGYLREKKKGVGFLQGVVKQQILVGLKALQKGVQSWFVLSWKTF